MKILLVLILLLLGGCTNETMYDEYLKEIKSVETFTSNLPFDLNIFEDSIGEEVMYQIVIDNPQFEIQGLRCLAINNKTNEMFPNIGLFEDAYTLTNDRINENENRVKGISLVGYVDDNTNIEYRVICKYENESKTIYYQYPTK